MPLAADTAIAVGQQNTGQPNEGVDFRDASRSLMLERFANPALEKDHRRNFFLNASKKKKLLEKRDCWSHFLFDLLGLMPDQILFARLRSRLMVNMAGGVMENAGLCLDRFGIAYVPGSAVKGCARRMAIQKLFEARLGKRSGDELAKFLADIAMVFGWGQGDWKGDINKRGNVESDFVYAIGNDLWPEVCIAARCLLPKRPTDLGQFAGAVSFLPAYPSELPEDDIELDVVTCHHRCYYDEPSKPKGVPESEWKREHDGWNANWGAAPDTEEPNPVFFLTIAPEIVFQFAVLALRGERNSLSQPDAKLHTLAKDWLRHGLETFGLGAKTAAGYGWFKEVGPAGKPSGSASVHTRGTVAQPPATTAAQAEHPLIRQWRGHATIENFRVFLPELAAIEDPEELRRVFSAIIPENERKRLRKSNRYWQSFVSRPHGQKILQRLRIILQ